MKVHVAAQLRIVRNVLIAAMMVPLVACSIVNPHVQPEMPNPYRVQLGASAKDGGTGRDATPEFAGGMSEAIGYAFSVREAYAKAVGEQSKLRSGAALLVIPATAAALALGITGGSTELITGLAVGGAATYGLATYFNNPQLQPIYLAGSQAVGCAILTMRPFLITTSTYDRAVDGLDDIQGQVGEVIDAIGGVVAAIGNMPDKTTALVVFARGRIEVARTIVNRATAARANGDLVVENVAGASLTLVTNVELIRDQVSTEIAKREPTLESIRTIASGLSRLSADFSPTTGSAGEAITLQGADLSGAIGIDEPDPETALRLAVNALESQMSTLEGTIRPIERLVEKVQAAQEDIDQIEECRPEDFTPALRIIPPGPITAPATPGRARFIIKGGKAPFMVELMRDQAGVSVEQTPAFSANAAIVVGENAAEGENSVLVTDGAGSTEIFSLVIGKAQALTIITREGDDKKDVKNQDKAPPEDAFLSLQDKRDVQKKLCVTDDGAFGPTTRRSIGEYQAKALNMANPDGVLTEEQADQLLSEKNCPEQYETFYELVLFGRDEVESKKRISAWQNGFNRARAKGTITFDPALAITGGLDNPTRGVMLGVQDAHDLDPADGIFSEALISVLDPLIPDESPADVQPSTSRPVAPALAPDQ